jgi:hypothetical protein
MRGAGPSPSTTRVSRSSPLKPLRLAQLALEALGGGAVEAHARRQLGRLALEGEDDQEVGSLGCGLAVLDG